MVTPKIMKLWHLSQSQINIYKEIMRIFRLIFRPINPHHPWPWLHKMNGIRLKVLSTQKLKICPPWPILGTLWSQSLLKLVFKGIQKWDFITFCKNFEHKCEWERGASFFGKTRDNSPNYCSRSCNNWYENGRAWIGTKRQIGIIAVFKRCPTTWDEDAV